MWFWIWAVLVTATLTGAAFLARDLWRRAKNVLAAQADLLAALDDAHARAADNPPATTTPRPVDVFTDREHLVTLVESRKAGRRRRAAQRRADHAARYEQWRRIDL
ncbi:hypothetical protein [Sanguibacter suaedae]|uniref:Uncharacterized protein n=1 Tax=Sanguibacter suaedae TaxID=2795737 RepID=A0A934MF02_9MICO|nr:hypothetical protein [Sanguibacter suaedae]MBI9116159.1 hypothetical protein [Sanguibacter suaedae]